MNRKKNDPPNEFWISVSAIDLALADLDTADPGYFRTDIPNLKVALKFAPCFEKGFADIQIVEALKKRDSGDPDRLIDLVESARKVVMESLGDAAAVKLRGLDEELAQIKARPSKGSSKAKPKGASSSTARSVSSTAAKADPATDRLAPAHNEETAPNAAMPSGGKSTADDLPDFAQGV